MESAEVAAYRRRLKNIWNPSVDDDRAEAIIRRHLPLLRQLDQVEGGSVALLDLRDFRYRFLTERLRLIPAEAAYDPPEDAQAWFFSLIPPGDREFTIATTEAAFRFLAARPRAERPEFRLCFEFHIRAGEAPPVRLLQQTLVLEQDGDGIPWLILIVNDRSPQQDPALPLRRQLVHTPSGEEFLFPPDEEAAPPSLSRRELEILGLISRGFVSREIAGALSISIHTVNNHRAAILAKMEAENCFEAVTRAAKLGLV